MVQVIQIRYNEVRSESLAEHKGRLETGTFHLSVWQNKVPENVILKIPI